MKWLIDKDCQLTTNPVQPTMATGGEVISVSRKEFRLPKSM
jgi:hypothetical protein